MLNVGAGRMLLRSWAELGAVIHHHNQVIRAKSQEHHWHSQRGHTTVARLGDACWGPARRNRQRGGFAYSPMTNRSLYWGEPRSITTH